MKPLIITSMIALILVAGPSGTPLRAEDAHHPEKSAKAKKSTAPKRPEKKKPTVQTKKSNQSE